MTYRFDSQKLIILRQENYWTQEELATASGLSVRTIQRMEKAQSTSADSWKAIAAAFDIPLEIFCLTVEGKPKYNDVEKRKAILGMTIGCVGGLIGLSFAWLALLQNSAGLFGAFGTYPVMTTYVTFSTAVCFIAPVWTWQRTLQ